MNTKRKEERLPEQIGIKAGSYEDNLIIQPIYMGSILALDGFIRYYT
jgi:hypothetical protein